MVIAGLGMGLLMPVYTVAVQNAAPHKNGFLYAFHTQIAVLAC